MLRTDLTTGRVIHELRTLKKMKGAADMFAGRSRLCLKFVLILICVIYVIYNCTEHPNQEH